MEDIKIELFIPGELKNEPIINDMIKNYDVEVKIIEASFSAESGWALLDLKGKKEETEKMFKNLRGKGITVELR